RPAAYHGDLVRKRLACLVEHLGDIARLRGELLVGDELLDVVDGYRLVDVAAGAGVLAAAVADAPADRREGVLLLDELQRLQVPALAGELDVALHGDVRGTLHFARRGAAVHNVPAVGAVVHIV